MLDIGSVIKGLYAGEAREKVDEIQVKGKRLALRILGTFTLEGHRAVQLVGANDVYYHALIHNEPDDPTDYLVVHIAGDNEHLFNASNIGDDWVTDYADMEHYEPLMRSTAEVLLTAASEAYAVFVRRNFCYDPPALTEKEVDVDAFAEDLSHKDLSLSHQGNKRLVGAS
jgi:hypothetical protein